MDQTYLVDTLCYKLKGHGFDSDEATVLFNLPNPSSCTMDLALTQPLTEMSIRNLLGGKG
jgi:hypothetical protein